MADDESARRDLVVAGRDAGDDAAGRVLQHGVRRRRQRLPIYSGGLGILAGDHLKAAAELGLPLVGVGLLYRGGYFTQGLSDEGRQTETYTPIDPEALGLAPRAGHRRGRPGGRDGHRGRLALRRRHGRCDAAPLPARRRPAHRRALLGRPRAPDPPGAPARRRRRARARRARARADGLPRQRGPLGVPRDRARAHARRAGPARATTRSSTSGARPSSRPTRPCPPATRSSATSSSSATSASLAAQAGLSDEKLLDARPQRRHRRLRPDAARAAALRATRTASRSCTARSPARCGRGLWPGEEPPIGYVTNGVHLGTWLAPELDELLRSVGVRPDAPPALGDWDAVHELDPDALWQTHVLLKERLAAAERARPEPPHDRLRAALRHLQAGRARLLRPRAAARAARADRRRRQGAPAGRAGQGRHAADRRALSRPRRRRAGRLPRELQHRPRAGDHPRLRHLAEHAAQALRGVGHERDEGGGQRRPEPVGARRLVGRGLRPVGRLGARRASPTRPTLPSSTACSRRTSCRASPTAAPGSS